MPAPVLVGCAGWSIPSAHAHLFGEGDSQLARYATRFPVVEINSTFYRPHLPATFERWAATVPKGFRFSAKLPRAITHDARLRGVGGALDAFLEQVGHLGDRLGGLLVQLPPSLRHDARTASTFFAMLRRRTGLPLACEPRHASWFEPGVDALWTRYRVARVAADPARLPAASVPGGDCSQWSYWRWHGSPRIYYSAYGEAALDALAGALRGRSRPGAPAWCILDNTAAGHAIPNAATLQAETE